jgi:hypothetical protein
MQTENGKEWCKMAGAEEEGTRIGILRNRGNRG